MEIGFLKMREERQLLKSLWPKETMSTWQLTLHEARQILGAMGIIGIQLCVI
jgi:hypothetical protein